MGAWKILSRWWSNRPGYQKVAVATVSGWLVGTPLTLGYQKFLEQHVSVEWFAQIIDAVQSALSDRLVMGFVIAAAIFGFGPTTWAMLRRAWASVDAGRRWLLARIGKEKTIADLAFRAIETAGRARDFLAEYDSTMSRLLPPSNSGSEDERELEREWHAALTVTMNKFRRSVLPEAAFLLRELNALGYVEEMPRTLDYPVNTFCVQDISTALDVSARRALAALESRGIDTMKLKAEWEVRTRRADGAKIRNAAHSR